MFEKFVIILDDKQKELKNSQQVIARFQNREPEQGIPARSEIMATVNFFRYPNNMGVFSDCFDLVQTTAQLVELFYFCKYGSNQKQISLVGEPGVVRPSQDSDLVRASF